MNKLALICISIILALGSLGVGYAYWTETLEIEGTVTTGELDWAFVGEPETNDVGNDYTCKQDELGVNPILRNKDVGNTTAFLTNTDGDDDYDTMTVIVQNAYPGYYAKIDTTVRNTGTLPLKVQGATLTYATDSPVAYNEGTVVEIGGGAMAVKCSFPSPGPAVIEPGDDPLQASLEILVLKEAEEETLYTFTFKITAIQFNQ